MPSADPTTLASGLKAEARRQGFDLAGITSPDPPPHLPTYQRWLEAGRHEVTWRGSVGLIRLTTLDCAERRALGTAPRALSR